jgi:acetyl esterase/lipase
MKLRIIAMALLALCGALNAKDVVWQPAVGHTQTPLWPSTPPDVQPMPGPERVTASDHLVGGKVWTSISNVTQPTLTVYAPKGRNTGAVVLVIPGGGFQILAMDLEGTEVCDWLVSKGTTCVVLKYRVPSAPYDWRCDCRPHNLEVPVQALEDVQRALRLIRHHAAEWRIDLHKVGVLGFSAGGYLVAEASTRFKQQLYAPIDAADHESTRPDFAVAIYPGHIATDEDALNPNVPVSHETPPTFLLQAEDDKVDGVNQSLVYYAALKSAEVPVEMHLYTHGGHAFGLRQTQFPITDWPRLVEAWLRTIGVVQD